MKKKEKENRPLSVWYYWWKLVQCSPKTYGGTTFMRIFIFVVIFQSVGLINRYFFDSLSNEAPFEWGPGAWAALLIGVALSRSCSILFDQYLFSSWIFVTQGVLSKNLLSHILKQPGAKSFPSTTGEAISRFREDTYEIGFFTAWAIFPVAQAIFGGIALVIMLQINPKVTLFVFLPLIVVLLLAHMATSRVQKYREENRDATGNVSGFIGEMFSMVQAIQVANAENRVLRHFQKLNESRRKFALKDRLFNEILDSIFKNTVNIGIGVILLSAGQAIQDGSFTLGDFSLFVFYLDEIANMITAIGMFLPKLKQSGVALNRMDAILEGGKPQDLIEKTPVYLRETPPAIPYTRKRKEHQLEFLQANLSYFHPNSKNGIQNISFKIKRGSFTVITGRVGSGKTTVLRTLLGLLPSPESEISWNGEKVEHPDQFFVPPRTAYTSQIPMLFSNSLRENILMGIPEKEVNLKKALYSAILEKDLELLPEHLETEVGSRGVKLSGGQKQRSAAARMFVREPELFVFDDLSSALDIQTEQKLWERMFERKGATSLVVSHRKPALQRADHIIVLKDGKIEDEGTLPELLEHCTEMQQLWDGLFDEKKV